MTQKEADILIKMLKHTLVEAINFPDAGKKVSFEVQGDTQKHLFDISIYRSKIAGKINYETIIKRDHLILLELHVGKTLIHRNPDGNVIKGSHWHIYSEEYGRTMAEPAVSVMDTDFEKNTSLFFERINLIEPPQVRYP